MDQAISNWFGLHRTGWATEFMRDVTALGGKPVLVLVVVFAAGLLVALHRRRAALFVLASVLGATLLDSFAKDLVGRARPALTDPALLPLMPHNGSFPSGHSLVSVVVYLTLALLVAAHLRSRAGRLVLLGGSLALCFLIGFSRIYLGVHYFTDVLAGWATGLTWTLVCYRAAGAWLRQPRYLPVPARVEEPVQAAEAA